MIRNEATQNQVDAAQPQENTWLSANAGSGKTRVLTDRVARLLLQGANPQNILCLTYTNAAATEMQNRLFKRLGAWSMMPDDQLRNSLSELGEAGPFDADFLAKARALFAHAVETPGGLKIQTIHSFCAGVLRRFPLEAGISPQFQEMDDRAATKLRRDLLDQMAEGPAGAAFANFLAHFSDADLDGITGEITKHAARFRHEPKRATLARLMDVEPELSVQDILAQVFTDGTKALLNDLIAICSAGSSTEQKAATRLQGINIAAPSSSDLDVLEGLFLFGEKAKDPFGPKVGSFPTKPTAAAHPSVIDQLNPLMQLVAQMRPQRLAVMAVDRSYALHCFAHPFVAAYEQAKLFRGVLDYDDLIGKTHQLLSDRAVAQWVLFRLDGGIDHVLVDEAQDTSPSQWSVINLLTEEFTAGRGAGARDSRTLFVVGDKKQSIYSFQGADPDEFDRMLAAFRDRFRDAGLGLQDRSLRYSFRSSQAILRVVDNTFAGPRSRGLEPDVSHLAFKENLPGRVDLWPVIDAVKPDESGRNWFEPVDHLGSKHHNVILADQVADQIAHMIECEWLPDEDPETGALVRRRPTPGDFLILVQRRSELFSQLIRACKARGLQIAGADRLRIGAELAVKDIVATLQFLALPEDDLSLASALKSPLFGWSEQDLFRQAKGRAKGVFLWSVLRNSTEHPKTLEILNDMRRQSDFLRPFELISRLLVRHDGRRRLIARLGAEAEDGIDALLSQALEYERSEAASLTGFLGWLESDDLEIKRQMSGDEDKIRVMSVHGAKGLEAPIVILPETQKRTLSSRNALVTLHDQALWKPKAADMPPVLKDRLSDLQDAQLRERLRLLYVAMTRAEKWLIVAAAGDVGTGDDSWYGIVSEGIAQSGAVNTTTGAVSHLRVSHLDWERLPERSTQNAETPDPLAPAFGPLLPPQKVATLSPSELGGAKTLAEEGDADPDALRRGTLMHILLERLPAITASVRKAFGHRIIAQEAPDLPDASDLLDRALAMIASGDTAHVFASDTLAEVAVTAEIEVLGGRRIHGAIDRLIVGASDILAVDFKTNRVVPDQEEGTPEGILRQMGAYQAALSQIYPGHQVRTAILWTETARLMVLPNELVSAALARVTVP